MKGRARPPGLEKVVADDIATKLVNYFDAHQFTTKLTIFLTEHASKIVPGAGDEFSLEAHEVYNQFLAVVENILAGKFTLVHCVLLSSTQFMQLL